jgi:hypothetical protein
VSGIFGWSPLQKLTNTSQIIGLISRNVSLWTRIHTKTNSQKRSPFQELIFPHLVKIWTEFYEIRRFITVFIKAYHWTQTQASLIHSITTSYFFTIHCNVLPPTVSIWSLSFRFFDGTFVWISHLRACYMPRPSYPPCFDHCINILCRSQWQSGLKQILSSATRTLGS